MLMDTQNAGPVAQGLRVINPSELDNVKQTNYVESASDGTTNNFSSASSSTDSQKSCSIWPNCGFEDRTFRVGKLLGRYPLLAIIISVSIIATGSMGFLNFRIEWRTEELWLDRESSASISRTIARTFPTENRIRLSVLITAPKVFSEDVFDLVKQIDDTVKGFSFRGKTWDELCFKKESKCQKFSLLSFLGESSVPLNAIPDTALSIVNQPGMRKFTLIPPYFVAPEDVLIPNSIFSGEFNQTQLTRMVFFLQRQQPDRITSSKPVAPQEALHKYLVELFGPGFGNVSVSINVQYEDRNDVESVLLVPVDYFPALLYSCIAFLLAIFIATGKYTVARNGFWLAISGLIGAVLATAFGFGIASAVGLSFTPLHFILPVFILGMTVFGFLVMEHELSVINDARPNLLRSEKMGWTMQRSFSTLVLCLLSNFLLFAIGIGSKLPIIRSFCVFGVTSAVGIFIVQVLFLFGCLSAWQGVYERTAGSWFCCRNKAKGKKDTSISLHSMLKPVFGFIASNLAENIGRVFVLVAMAVMTGVCIFFLFSIQVGFNIDRYELQASGGIVARSAENLSKFKNQDNSVACVYLGDIPYSHRLTEFRTFHSYLRDHVAVRPRSVSSWFDRYQIWFSEQARQSNLVQYGNLSAGGSNYRDKSAFDRELVRFVFERNFHEDVMLVRKKSDLVQILASRICFRFRVGMSAENYSSAVENIANVAKDLNLGEAHVDSKMLLEMLIQKKMTSELWILFGAYFVALLVISTVMLQSVVSSLIVFVSYSLITIQSIGFLASQKVLIDTTVLVSIFCFVAIIAQIIFYQATLFTRLAEKPKRKDRIKGALVAVGPLSLACGLCAIAIFVPFFETSLEVFQIILRVAFTTIAVGFVHIYLFLPVALSGVATPGKLSAATLRLREQFGRSKSRSPPIHYDGGVSAPPPQEVPNDQVHFVARNPLVRTGSTSSLKIHLKSAGLRAVLESFPGPESSVDGKEIAVSSNPHGGLDRDSLDDVEIIGRRD